MTEPERTTDALCIYAILHRARLCGRLLPKVQIHYMYHARYN